MRGLRFLNLVFFFKILNGNLAEETGVLKLCDLCTCSELSDVEARGLDFVLYIQCSELDRIEVADLDKIEWPENANGLKISAAFEGLGITTLGKLPPNAKVESLRFRNNAIKTYWPDPFSDLPNLRRLSFTQNELTEITPDLFTNVHYLEDLDLSFNKLTAFNSIDFVSLTNLKKLNLQSNLLKKIPIEALFSLTALEDLDLSKNGIYNIVLQKGDSALTGLKRLNLGNNRIRTVMKDSFPEDNSLELLDLSNNIIEIVEEDAFTTCTNLRELILGQNNITLTFALPSTLQIAIFKINTMYHWPKFPSNITYIDMSYNKLSEMYNESDVDFGNLEVLSIAGNQIKEVNIEEKLHKLSVLDLSYNLLNEIPKTLNSQTLPNLEELRLDGNPIESIYFKNIVALRNLYMNELFKLSVVDDKAFSNVIGHGADESDGEICFSLFLSGCSFLSEVHEGAFAGTSLCSLDLSKNNLTTLPHNLVPWSSLSEVNLQQNPWSCTCDMQWLVEDFLPHVYLTNPRFLEDLRCASPRAFEGRRLVHFYNWTEKVLCMDQPNLGPRGPLVEQSTSSSTNVTSLTIILGSCAIVSLLILIALSVYLIRTRRRYRIRQAALRRKRQSAQDAKNTNGTKEQFTALNRA